MSQGLQQIAVLLKASKKKDPRLPSPNVTPKPETEEEKRRKQFLGRQNLLRPSPQGVLSEARVGRKKLTAF